MQCSPQLHIRTEVERCTLFAWINPTWVERYSFVLVQLCRVSIRLEFDYI